MNLPNKLSLIRILLIPIIMIVYFIEPLRNIVVFEGILNLSWCNLIILILAIAGALTDFFDGQYARKHNLVTDLGKFLDPLADKLLVVTLLIIIYDQGHYYQHIFDTTPSIQRSGDTFTILIEWWMIIIILAREFMVTGIRLIAAGKKEVIAASKLGKLKTVLQFITLIFILSGCAVLKDPTDGILYNYSLAFIIISKILIIATLAMTIFSGYDYIEKNIHFLKDNSIKTKSKKSKKNKGE